MNDNTDASPYCLDHVTNSDLHQGTRQLVGRSNQVFAALLAHLAEVEARGIHRERACTSLYTYCIYELRMSEDAAFRRARAAKIARQFPILFEQIAAGEIHLSGVLMLGPVLTDANHRAVLALAKHRTKRELARLVRLVSPLADARCVVAPLGPANSRPLIEQSGPIRELNPGDRPRDWMQSDSATLFGALATGDEDAAVATTSSAIASSEATTSETSGDATSGDAAPSPAAPSRLLVPQRYMIQFTASQEYVDLLQKAKDLSAFETRSLVEIHLDAMRLFVAELEKRRCGAKNKRLTECPDASRAEADLPAEHEQSGVIPRQRGISSESLERESTAESPHEQGDDAGGADSPRRRGRYVPRAVRRTVWQRDEGRCTYIDERGVRCRETTCLELDHELPHARGGPPSARNLRLRCRAHNQLTGEHDFGHEFMKRKKGIAQRNGAA